MRIRRSRGEGVIVPERDFDAFFRAHWRPLLSSLTAMTLDPSSAEEAAAEAMTRALERWDRVQQMESPRGWLFRVAQNLARRRARRRRLEDALLRRAHPDPAQIVTSDPDLWRAVSKLPNRQRHAIALRYLAGLTEVEVGTTLGISTGGASSLLSMARTRLREQLDEGA